MSYSEAMKYTTEVERGVEMEIYRREMEQQEYEELLENVREDMLSKLYLFKQKNKHRLNDTEWEDMEEYFEDYDYEENSDFDEILEEYYDYIVDRYSWIIYK